MWGPTLELCGRLHDSSSSFQITSYNMLLQTVLQNNHRSPVTSCEVTMRHNNWDVVYTGHGPAGLVLVQTRGTPACGPDVTDKEGVIHTSEATAHNTAGMLLGSGHWSLISCSGVAAFVILHYTQYTHWKWTNLSVEPLQQNYLTTVYVSDL